MPGVIVHKVRDRNDGCRWLERAAAFVLEREIMDAALVVVWAWGVGGLVEIAGRGRFVGGEGPWRSGKGIGHRGPKRRITVI